MSTLSKPWARPLSGYKPDQTEALLVGGMLKLWVECRAQAGALNDRMSFVVAISDETVVGSGIAIYDQVRTAIQRAIHATTSAARE